MLALAVVGLASRTVRRNADWRDDVALFESSLAVNPRSVIASFNLGSALRDRGDLAGAEGAWRRALEIDPGEAGSTIQLGTLAAVRGDMGEAERLYRSAQEREPGNALLQLNLARLLERTARPREALVHYDRFLELATKDHAEYVRGAREIRERILRQLGDTR
jgi:tetratricopeptide (TPR) repeat protein